MVHREFNSAMLGIGIIGIAAFFLWPRHHATITPNNPLYPAAVAQLNGLTVPGLPDYLSANRPDYAITPQVTPFAPFFGGTLPDSGVVPWVDPGFNLPQPAATLFGPADNGCGCG